MYSSPRRLTLAPLFNSSTTSFFLSMLNSLYFRLVAILIKLQMIMLTSKNILSALFILPFQRNYILISVNQSMKLYGQYVRLLISCTLLDIFPKYIYDRENFDHPTIGNDHILHHRQENYHSIYVCCHNYPYIQACLIYPGKFLFIVQKLVFNV